jgi:DNA invertase Pin-like site-specific DNA recombinase
MSKRQAKQDEKELKTPKFIGYTRVSSEKQAKEGVSLDAQKKMIQDYAESKGLELVDIISEQVSGSVVCTERKGFSKIFEMMDKREINGLIVAKLDRISRNISDQSSILDKYFSTGKNKLIIVEMDRIDLANPSDKMLINMLGSLSQYERDLIISRTTTAMKYKKSKGEKLGGFIPYGKMLSDDGKTLLDNKDELDILNKYRDLHEKQGYSFRRIAEMLVAEGFKNRTGSAKWDGSGVARILYPDKYKRKVYKRTGKD